MGQYWSQTHLITATGKNLAHVTCKFIGIEFLQNKILPAIEKDTIMSRNWYLYIINQATLTHSSDARHNKTREILYECVRKISLLLRPILSSLPMLISVSGIKNDRLAAIDVLNRFRYNDKKLSYKSFAH